MKTFFRLQNKIRAMAVMVIALCVVLFEHLLQLFGGGFIGAF